MKGGLRDTEHRMIKSKYISTQNSRRKGERSKRTGTFEQMDYQEFSRSDGRTIIHRCLVHSISKIGQTVPDQEKMCLNIL